MTRASRIPKIYIAAFGSDHSGEIDCQALAEDGEGLAECSGRDLETVKMKIGYTSQVNHADYAAHFPAGYELEWVNEPAKHRGWQSALKRNREKQRSPSP